MQAEKILLETDQNGRLLQQPQLPPNVRIEAIFLLLEDKVKSSKTTRKPSKKIMGKGKIIGDLKAPVSFDGIFPSYIELNDLLITENL